MKNTINSISSFPQDVIRTCISSLTEQTTDKNIEDILIQTFGTAPSSIMPDANDYYSLINHYLYKYILKAYKGREDQICLWRFIKRISDDQLNLVHEKGSKLFMLDCLIRIYFYSDPLDDLTCIFIPINDNILIKKYLEWIKHYFYNVNYPTSLLWFYALDSSLSRLFPDEILYFGKKSGNKHENIVIPDFTYTESALIKRFSDKPDHYVNLEGMSANNEFEQIFTFLKKEYKDRCLSRSVKTTGSIEKEWEKFEDVLKFGVSDKAESGCISFSDMRASTEFLNSYGKSIFLNKIQQPFFEKTKLISKKYGGRIDKFMGDNVMSVFLNNNMIGKTEEECEERAVLHNFLSLFSLCKILFDVEVEGNFIDSGLGLRSGVTHGYELLRSNLGNEIVRDFTVTGETVNFASRLEHITMHELIMHNKTYFGRTIDRFPQISELISVGNQESLSPETKTVIRSFTMYQNIISNLEKLEKEKFDIRLNESFYFKLRNYFEKRGYKTLNIDTSEIYGYEEFNIEGFNLKFYFSHYNPKGFRQFAKIWILPLEPEVLTGLNIENLMPSL